MQALLAVAGAVFLVAYAAKKNRAQIQQTYLKFNTARPPLQVQNMGGQQPTCDPNLQSCVPPNEAPLSGGCNPEVQSCLSWD